MYLCKLVAVRKTSSRQNWCLCSTREKIKKHRTLEVLLRCRLCGQLGCVAVIPEDCYCWLKVVVGEGKSREGGALQAYGYIHTGNSEGSLVQMSYQCLGGLSGFGDLPCIQTPSDWGQSDPWVEELIGYSIFSASLPLACMSSLSRRLAEGD